MHGRGAAGGEAEAHAAAGSRRHGVGRYRRHCLGVQDRFEQLTSHQHSSTATTGSRSDTVFEQQHRSAGRRSTGEFPQGTREVWTRSVENRFARTWRGLRTRARARAFTNRQHEPSLEPSCPIDRVAVARSVTATLADSPRGPRCTSFRVSSLQQRKLAFH